MQDLIIWLACGFGAFVLLTIFSANVPVNGPKAQPSETAAVAFLCLVFGELSLFVVALVSVLAIIVGTLCLIGTWLDETFGSDR